MIAGFQDMPLISGRLLMKLFFLKQSQTYVAAWFFPVEYDQIKPSIASEKHSVEHPFPQVIVLSLNK